MAGENAGKRPGVVSGSADENRVDLRVSLDSAYEGLDSRGIAAVADDVDDFHAAAHETVEDVNGRQYRI